MQTKPVKLLSTVAITGLCLWPTNPVLAQDSPKAPPPIQVVIYDSQSLYGDNVPKIVVQTRDDLRNDKRFEVLLFNPDSPTFTLAASSTNPPITLDSVQSSTDELSLSNAVGAAFYVDLTPDNRGRKSSAIIVNVETGSQQSIDKQESPNDLASDVANLIESWPPAAATLAAVAPAAIAHAPTVAPPAILPPAPAVTAPVPAASLAIPIVPTPVHVKTVPAPTPGVITPVPIVVTPAPVITPSAPIVTAPNIKPAMPAAEPAAVLSAGAEPLVNSPTLDTSETGTKAAPNPIPVAPDATPDSSPAVATAPNAVTSPQSNPSAAVLAQPVTTPPVINAAPPPPIAAAAPVLAAPAVTMAPAQTESSAPVVKTINVPPVTTVVQVPAVVSAPSQSPETTPAPSVLTPPKRSDDPVAAASSVTIIGVTAQSSAPLATPPSSAANVPSPGSVVSDAAQKWIDQGDAALQSSDNLAAISDYQEAISIAPRAAGPRLKLANAYLEAGMKDQASQEARRALAIDPGNADVQTFIQSQDNGPGASNGDVIIALAKTESDPNNPAAWISLGDAYWNVGDPDDSLISYKHAADIDPAAILPQTRLAKLYAARAQYDESLTALQRSGADGYPFALRIIASRSESLVGDIDDEIDLFTKGQDTREQFYNKIKTTDSQAEGLADFVAKITPPDQYKVSHLHRELSTRLLAQTASVWIDYAETNRDSDKDQAAVLEKHAIEEMKTASVAEDISARINP